MQAIIRAWPPRSRPLPGRLSHHPDPARPAAL